MSTSSVPPIVPDASAPRVVVVGAGIAGAAAAAFVRAARPDAQIVVLEAADRVGGKLRVEEIAGITTDVGAEAMLARRPEAVDLARAAGLEDDLVHPATISASLWNRDQLVPMPRTLMGVPGDVAALEPVLSRAGQLRAALEPRLPATEIGDGDISVGRLVEDRFGREVVDRLVEPLLGGVYAGHAREISARAAVPQVVALLDRDRSLARAAAAALAAAAPRPGEPAIPVFTGLRGGVGRLPEAVLASARAEVRLGATVRDLVRRADGDWHLLVGDTRDPRLVPADVVILATPARASARLLSDAAPVAALELARIDYASMAIVTLALPVDQLPPRHGSGFLVPPVDGHRIKAATYSDAKWAWVAQAGAADGIALVRCSLGRHHDEAALQVDDATLVEQAVADLGAALRRRLQPIESHVQRWGGALPQYAVGHLDRIALIRREVERVPGLAVCGAAFEGLGIPACIASARRAVDSVLDRLETMSA